MRRWVLPLVGIASMICGIFCWPLLGVGLATWLIVLAWRRQWRGFAAVAVLNPLSLMLLYTTGEYFAGAGRLHLHGLPAVTAQNLRRDTRLRPHSMGCTVCGQEWLTDGFHNAVLEGCVALLGPMRGSYTGYYPTEEQVCGGWEGAEPVDMDSFYRGLPVTLAGVPRPIPYQDQLLEFFAPIIGWRPDEGDDDSVGGIEIRARDLGQGTFALRLTWTGDEAHWGPQDVIALFSISAGQPARLLAYYPVAGRGSMLLRYRYD